MIKKNDNVIVTTGKSRGHRGKVLRVLPREGKLQVEGANILKKRQRPRRQGEKGQVLLVTAPLPVSNVALWCGHCGRGVRVGVKLESGKKTRICRRCKRVV